MKLINLPEDRQLLRGYDQESKPIYITPETQPLISISKNLWKSILSFFLRLLLKCKTEASFKREERYSLYKPGLDGKNIEDHKSFTD